MKKLANLFLTGPLLLLLFAGTSCQEEAIRFARSPEQLLTNMPGSDAYVLSPAAARQVQQTPSESQQLVDLRSPFEFDKGHLTGAINIPAEQLLQPDFLEIFAKKDVEFILYGQDQAAANGPWLLLRQLGIENVKVLPGGYQYFSAESDPGKLTLAEEPGFDYAAVFTSAVERHKKEAEAVKPPPLPAPPKKIVPKPKKKKVEEEEGC